MQKIIFSILFLLSAVSVANAADLFDLRVFPCFENQIVSFEGTIVTSRLRENAISRRSKFSGLTGKWLASGTVDIESADKKLSADVSKGEFSGQIKVDSLASFTLSVYHNGQKLYRETFHFPTRADFIVVSDIDDTILVTEVTSKAKMVYNSLFKKLEDRKPVADTPKFYRELSKGNFSLGTPHFIYLSSSPAFLSRSLKTFIKNNDFPQGSLILKKSLTSGDHNTHKSEWLKQIVKKYPGKPLFLMGDSGEQDPFIYRSFIENSESPKIVKGVVIHEVTSRPQKIQALKEISLYLQKKFKVPFVFWSNIDKLKKSLHRHSLLKRIQ